MACFEGQSESKGADGPGEMDGFALLLGLGEEVPEESPRHRWPYEWKHEGSSLLCSRDLSLRSEEAKDFSC